MRSRSVIMMLVLLGQVLSSSCSKDINEADQVLSLFKITKPDPWSQGDRCAFFPADDASRSSTAPALVPGSMVSDFRVMLPADYASEEIVVIYPADAQYSYDGKLNVTIPVSQNGEMMTIAAGVSPSGEPSSSRDVTLVSVCPVLSVHAAGMQVRSLEISAVGGENIAGRTVIDMRSWTAEADGQRVKVDCQSFVDKNQESGIPVMLAPCCLSQGLEICLEDMEGNRITEMVPYVSALNAGMKTDIYIGSDPPERNTSLAVCGDNMVYFISPSEEKDFEDCVRWSLDVKSLSSRLGLKVDRCDHVDECKVLDNGTKLLVTSSYSFAFLMDVQTKEILWCSNRCPNAHSAVLLPGNRIAVATASGDDAYHRKVLIYDLSVDHQEICRYEVRSCHGLVWNEERQRLYACGLHETDNNIGAVYEFSLKDWESPSPELVLERTSYTPAKTKSLHDLTPVDGSRLMVAGSSAWFYDMDAGSYTEIPHFSRYAQLKSVNYNPETGECWYTAADNRTPVPEKESSTRQICYTSDISGNDARMVCETPHDIYKVRVINW